MAATFWARTDSNNANNPALNLTGDPAVEVTFVPTGPTGDLILEYAGGGIDPDTSVVIGGVSYDFVFELSALLPVTKNNGSQQVPDQFEGSVVYIVTIQDYPSAGETTRLTFLPNDAATETEMDDFGNGAIDLQVIDTVTPGAVCFANGTNILTPRGEICVEDLKVGDLVTTLDHGPKPILWISKSQHSWPRSSDNELPILISSGTFGSDLHHKDLIVSPQHRILLYVENTQTHAINYEVLAPATGLVSLAGIRCMKGKREVVYYHILLERHEILISDGVVSESFFPGPIALKMLRPHQRNQIFTLFPALKVNQVDENCYAPKARKCLSVPEAKTLVANVQQIANLQFRQPSETEHQLIA